MAWVSILALIGVVLFALVAVGWRTWLQWRKTGDTGLRGLSRSPVELLAGLALVLGLGGVVAAPIVDLVGVLRVAPGVSRSASGVAGVLIFLAGFVLTVRAQLDMGSSWRIGVDPSESTELVATGVFRFVRNPIFTGMMLAALGLALMVPSVLAWVGVVLLVAGLQIQVRLVEEPYLETTHADRYRAYARRAGRFVPRLGRYG